MKPKEKAKKLVKKFEDYVAIDYRYDEKPIYDLQKGCAIIVINEMLKIIPKLKGLSNPNQDIIDYLKEVKTEIEKQ